MLHIKSYVKLWQPIKNDPSGIFISLTKVSNSADKKRHDFRKQNALKIELFKHVKNKKHAPKLIFFNEKKNLERFGQFLT